MATLDFESEPAYWYIKTVRDSEKAQLPVRSRPAVSAGERTIAKEIRRRVDRQVSGYRAAGQRSAYDAFADLVKAAHTCAACGQSFTRRDWRERRLWRCVYPRGGGRIELWKHSVCPIAGKVKHA